jgi:hypothetical protein
VKYKSSVRSTLYLDVHSSNLMKVTLTLTASNGFCNAILLAICSCLHVLAVECVACKERNSECIVSCTTLENAPHSTCVLASTNNALRLVVDSFCYYCWFHCICIGELNEEDLLANDNSIIVVTRAGYIKRMPLAEFQVSNVLYPEHTTNTTAH